MGTHPKVPSLRHDDKKPLRDIIGEDPKRLLGSAVCEKFQISNCLPFLFKILSINKVLSIQAHPDKALGKILREQDPKNYPDDNHKPEMAIAVTDFEGLCGFKPLEELADELNRIPELRNIVGEQVANEFTTKIQTGVVKGSSEDEENKRLLQAVFDKVMNASDEKVAQNARNLVQRAHERPNDFNKSELPELIIRLNKQFPEDIGLFCGCLLLNHCKLQAGEGMFLRAKDPHAYISGDIVECMAASDNVVRAGFTPKFKDVKNLVSMLTYSYDPVEEQKMKPKTWGKCSGAGITTNFDPPIEEFAVLYTIFKDAIGTRHFEGLDGPSILITARGSGEITAAGKTLKAEPGYVFFIAANTSVDVKALDSDFTTFRAFASCD